MTSKKISLGNLTEGAFCLVKLDTMALDIVRIDRFNVSSGIRVSANCTRHCYRQDGVWSKYTVPTKVRLDTMHAVMPVPDDITLNKLNERKEIDRKFKYKDVTFEVFAEHLQGKTVVNKVYVDFNHDYWMLSDETVVSVGVELSACVGEYYIGQECPVIVDGLGISIAEGD